MFVLLLLGVSAMLLRAQDTSDYGESAYGYSIVTFTVGTNQVYGYTETDLDPDLENYYEAKVNGKLAKNGTVVASGLDLDASGLGYAYVSFTIPGVANSTYTMSGIHEGWMGACSDCVAGGGYYDGYDESYWTAFNIYALDGFFDFYNGPYTPPVRPNPEIGLGTSSDSATITTPAPCGDDRDTIIKEYYSLGVTLHPVCSSFSSTAQLGSIFTFSQLNSSYFPDWAILLSSLYSGTANTQSNYGSSLTPNSGYRDPQKEKDIDTGQGMTSIWTVNSRHEYGDAVDLATGSILTTFNSIRSAGLKAGACAEPKANSGVAHVHLDWRTSDGATCSSLWLQ